MKIYVINDKMGVDNFPKYYALDSFSVRGYSSLKDIPDLEETYIKTNLERYVEQLIHCRNSYDGFTNARLNVISHNVDKLLTELESIFDYGEW